MCMFSRPVESVAKTRLLYALLHARDGARHALQVYANEVKLERGVPATAMILPVPTAKPICLLNCEGDTSALDLCQWLHDAFEAEKPPPTRGFSYGKSLSFGAASSTLAVVQSGAYQVSEVPTLEDFGRLDPGVFRFDAQLEAMLRRHYANGQYRFLAFVLRADAKYEPFAYSYELPADATTGFIPTRHYHPSSSSSGASTSTSTLFKGFGSVATTFGFGAYSASASSSSSSSSSDDVADDWDHEIFVVGVADPKRCVYDTNDYYAKLRQSCHAQVTRALCALFGDARDIGVVAECPAYRLEIRGRSVNRDMVVALDERILMPHLHDGIWCNACRTMLVGRAPRWACLLCRAEVGVDLCDGCHATNRAPPEHASHSLAHPLLEVKTAEDALAYAFMRNKLARQQ